MSEILGGFSLDQVITAAFQLTTVRYTAVAGFIVWLWDIFLTFDEEVLLLWSDPQWKKGALVKGLYIVNRYLPIVGLTIVLYEENPLRTSAIPIAVCRGTYFVMLFCQATEVVVATSIFAARLHTLFTGQRFIQRFLLVMLFLSHISIYLSGFLSYYYVYPTVYYSDFALACSGVPPWSWGLLYLTPIFIETVIVALTIYHAVKFRKDRDVLKGTVAVSILYRLYLDGCMYFVIVLTLRIGTSLVFFLAPLPLILLLCYLEYALTSALTSRWVLSFRRTVLATKSSGLDLDYTKGDFETDYRIPEIMDSQQKHRRRHSALELKTFGSTVSDLRIHTQ